MLASRVSRRSFLKLTAGIGATSALAACVAPPAQVGAPAAAAIVIGWARHGDETAMGTEEGLSALFQDKHPNVEIDPIVLPWSDYNTKIPIDIAGGTAPDTFGCHPALLIQTYNAEGLVLLDERIAAAEPGIDYEDVLYHGDASFNGNVVGLPQKSCTHQLRYNKDIFAAAGLDHPGTLFWRGGADAWNFNSFVEIGRQLTQDLDGDGETDQYFYAGTGGTNLLALVRAAGGEVFDDMIATCTLDSQAAVEGIAWIAGLVTEHAIQPPPEMQVNELGITFDTGRMVMAGGTTCDSVRNLQEGRRLPFAWDFVLLPAGPQGFRCWGDTDQIVISSTSPNADAAFDWTAYRSSREVWEEAYDAGTTLAFSDGPTRWSIFESRAFTEPLGELDIEMIKEGYRQTIPNPFVPRSREPYRVLFTIIPTEVNNVMRGTKSAQEAADAICALIESEILTQ